MESNATAFLRFGSIMAKLRASEGERVDTHRFSARRSLARGVRLSWALALLLAVPLLSLVMLAAPAARAADEPSGISRQAIQQIAAIQAEKETWTPAQRKVASKLLLAAKKSRRAPMVAGMPELRSAIALDSENKVLIDIRADVTDKLLDRIRALGGEVISSFPQYDAARARVPITQIETLAAESAVQAIRPADAMFTNKTNTSQGDVAHRADDARAGFGVDGTGVKVGVLSDSVDSLAALQASGDLPATVTVLPGQSGNPGTSEGTAMMEIAYDLAPGASLYFATAFGSQAAFANNIIALKNAGCKVIVDDVGYFAEPVFQDGIIAQAVETVSAAGALYFSSAGNSGNKNDGTSGVWEGDFVPTTVPSAIGYGQAHDFGGANSNLITADSPSYFTLQWSDPAGGSANDYDLFLMNSTLTSVYDYSTSNQTGTQDPFEAIDTTAFNDAGNRLVIVRYSGASRYLHLNANRGRLSANTAGQTYGHSAAASAYSVAAVSVSTAGGGHFTGGPSNPVETYSSDGPRRVFYLANGTAITPGNFSSTGGALRQKPDIAAADCIAAATPGFNPFCGTSAAAPHAAAVAALLLGYCPSLTTAQVRTALTGSALDIEASGVDRDSGWGIVNAITALSFVAPVPPTSASASPAAICSGASSTLTATGGSGDELRWSTSCHGTVIGTGDGISVSPASTTTYFAWWHNGCGDSDCASVEVTVNPLPVAPTSASASPAMIVRGASSTLTATGGSGDSCKWYTGSCGGTLVGTGTSVSVSPTSTTTYYVRWENGCGNSTCATTTVNVHAYGVRISDLSHSPIPPNPIRVWGKVTSESPLKISDGRAEITVIGLTASLGEYLVVTGDWNGTVLTVNGGITRYLGPAGTEMIYIPAGDFLMGNNGSEPYSYSNELPQHSVSLSAYYIGKYEVTRGQYRAFMNAGGYSTQSYWSTDGWSWRVSNNRTEPDYWAATQTWSPTTFTQTDKHPVVGVSYYEAEAYCNWVGGQLPSEAQWEKAARWTGTYPNIYPWGNTWDVEKCNNYYDSNTAGGGYGKSQTAPVGSYPSGASPSGCQDMTGNVWEWCQDWYKSYPGSSSPFDYTDSYRVLRGGGWSDYGSIGYRCAARYYSFIQNNYADGDLGFRLAR